VIFILCFYVESTSEIVLSVGTQKGSYVKNIIFSLYIKTLYAISVQLLKEQNLFVFFNPLNPELNPICYLLALLGAHHFFYVSRIRVKLLTFRLLMSYIYIYIYDISRLRVNVGACCHTCYTTQLMHYSHFKAQSLQHLKPIKC